MGAGKAIVSTPYAYALEQLADGRGRLYPVGSAAALEQSLIDLLRDPELRFLLGRRAYEYSRRMVWSEVGAEYRRVFARAARPATPFVAPVQQLTAVAGLQHHDLIGPTGPE